MAQPPSKPLIPRSRLNFSRPFFGQAAVSDPPPWFNFVRNRRGADMSSLVTVRESTLYTAAAAAECCGALAAEHIPALHVSDWSA
eukprot:8161702-Pyramimonas_sp.AAC.1